MSEQTQNDRTLTRYLLGALPEAEAELLDEWSFTDDGFAGALEVVEKDLVDAYVQGELKGAALEQFETHYLASPLRRERVRFARAFQLAAEKTVGVESPEAQARAAPVAKRKSFWSPLLPISPLQPALRWGAAFAALVLVCAVGWLAFENARLRGEVSQTRAREAEFGRREQELQKELEGRRSAGAETESELARVRAESERSEPEQQSGRRAAGQRPSPHGGTGVASFVIMPQVRDAGQTREIVIPANAGRVAMRLWLEPNEHNAYRVALIAQSSNRTLWRSGNLRAMTTGDDKALNVRFGAGLLKPRAVYLLRVTGVSASGATEIVGDYLFRAMK